MKLATEQARDNAAFMAISFSLYLVSVDIRALFSSILQDKIVDLLQRGGIVPGFGVAPLFQSRLYYNNRRW